MTLSRFALGAVALLGMGACKPRVEGADTAVKSEVPFAGASMALDRYIASQADYDRMKDEFKLMARNHGGKPNYDDGVASITQRQPRFETLPGMALAMEEQVALLVWSTGSGETNSPFQQINKALRSPTVTDDWSVTGTVKTLASAVNKLKGKSCKAVRGVQSLPPALAGLKKGQTFKDNGFTAFSDNPRYRPAAPFDRMPIWIFVESPDCKHISMFSKFQAEGEVLFPPGTDFTVQDNYASNEASQVILLKHDGAPTPQAGASPASPVVNPSPAASPAPASPAASPKVSIGGVAGYQVFPGGIVRSSTGRVASCTLTFSNGKAISLKYKGKPTRDTSRCVNCGVFWYDDYYLVEWSSDDVPTRVSLFEGKYLEGI